ncbi:MAG TPA: hypothetical protein VLR89_06775 [Anaerolineaceae bacterium]|nr:hypothetical protein [Anaerolineaceae bacterium]
MKKINSRNNPLKNSALAAQVYWNIKGKNKTWASHFKLEGISQVLPGAVKDVEQLAVINPKAKNVFIFANLHYWIEQAVLIALALAGQGHHVTFCYLPYADWDKEISKFDLKRQDLYAQGILEPLKKVMKVVPLLEQLSEQISWSNYPSEVLEAVRQVALYDTMYTQQVEEIKEGDPLYTMRMQRNSVAGAAIYSWLKQNRPDVVIVPNGTILEMGVAYRMARLQGIRTVSFEFADQRERIWLAQDDEIMSHDTRDLWEALGNQPLPEAASEALEDLLNSRKGASTWGDFARRWQAAPSQGASTVAKDLGLDKRPVVLLPTNVLGDSLTLGRQKITNSMAEWVVDTIRYFLQKPNAQLVIRVHPGELKTHGTSMVEVIEDNFARLPENIHLIRPEDPINTYDLIELASVGLVYTTTVGLEMAMAGLPVVVTGRTHYAQKGFTYDPVDWPAYQNMLDKILAKPREARLSPKQTEQAWLYAYLFFFEFSLPFPWHLLWLAEDFKARPLRFVLNQQGQARYAQTFNYLVGEPLDWKKHGLARLQEITNKGSQTNA